MFLGGSTLSVIQNVSSTSQYSVLKRILHHHSLPIPGLSRRVDPSILRAIALSVCSKMVELRGVEPLCSSAFRLPTTSLVLLIKRVFYNTRTSLVLSSACYYCYNLIYLTIAISLSDECLIQRESTKHSGSLSSYCNRLKRSTKGSHDALKAVLNGSNAVYCFC